MQRLQLLLFFFFVIALSSCAQKSPDVPKINGVSFVASPNEVQQENVTPVLNIHANYASVMPFGFIRSLNNPEIVFNIERQWYGETKDGAQQYIHKLHENNINVMLKPQIWIWRGEFTGYLKMNTERDWKTLEESYRNFILEFAQLAEDMKVSIFCIGTELEQFITNRPEYWKVLITEIKNIYKGKLTYAANWDEYKRVPFWKELDYIGVDAYFPVSESKTPTDEEVRNGWLKWKQEMQSVATTYNKKILFAEYGYRSVDFAGKEPWKSDRSMTAVNMEAQTNLTRVLFEEIWNQEWFAGGFLWKWYIDHEESGGLNNARFTPQNKPAEEIIKEKYRISK